MPRYEVSINWTGEVEADNKELACDAAIDEIMSDDCDVTEIDEDDQEDPLG